MYRSAGPPEPLDRAAVEGIRGVAVAQQRLAAGLGGTRELYRRGAVPVASEIDSASLMGAEAAWNSPA